MPIRVQRFWPSRSELGKKSSTGLFTFMFSYYSVDLLAWPLTGMRHRVKYGILLSGLCTPLQVLPIAEIQI